MKKLFINTWNYYKTPIIILCNYINLLKMGKNTDGELAKFMADPNYQVTIASADCDKDPTELINHLIKQGYEVWPELRSSDNKKCDVICRKLKDKQ